MQPHKIVSHDQWIAARKAYLAEEKAFSRARDALAKKRRELPWEKVEKKYVFDSLGGKETLPDLFAGKGQLIIYHFMLGPDWEAGCPSCSLLADHFDGSVVHLSQRCQLPPSPNTWKVRALASYLKLPLEFEFVDLSKGAQYAPSYLALNPTGRTPTLVDGDFKLWESNAILQYLAGKNGSSLWPNDPRARVDISRWQFWQLAHWGAEACQPLTFQRLAKKFMNMGPPDEAVVAKGTECFNKEAKMLDAHLAKQKISGRRCVDCRRLRGGRAPALCQASGNAARPVRERARLV
jgi:glutathione S-transferase